VTNKSANIDPIVLFSLLVLIPWGQCIPKRWDLVLVAPKENMKMLSVRNCREILTFYTC